MKTYDYNKIINDLTRKALEVISNNNNLKTKRFDFNKYKINKLFDFYDKIIKKIAIHFILQLIFYRKKKGKQ